MSNKIILNHVTTGLLSRRFRLTVALLVAMVHAGLQAGPLLPLDYVSLGSLVLTGGNYTIDTDALTITDDSAPATPLFTGIIDDQGGQADSYGPGGAVTTVGAQGIPHIAVFTFDAIDIAAAVNLTITGHRALAFLSHRDAVINADLDLSGEGTYTGASGSTALRGGPGGFDGGTGTPLMAGSGPGGGGFSSNAGHATAASGSGVPGIAYGDLNGVLQGGSGGGNDVSLLYGETGYGGGGGGALEIAASGIVELGGTIDVIG